MTRNAQIARAVRHALFTSALVAASASVYGQEQDQDQDQDQAEGVTTVTVTGSRIQRQDFEAASPVVTVSADTFDLSGEVQVETVLNSLPQLVPSITTTSNNPSNGGQANVDLRGLGTTRTLVLMDGTRLTPSNVFGVVDLNTIPAALIDSIEILTGGASATYGSDAIAGVVNVRMKRNFSGVQLNVQNNVTAESDGKTLLAEAVIGGNFADERGNAVLAMTYDRRDEVLAGARDFGRVSLNPQLAPFGSATIPGGRIDWGANAPTAGGANGLDAVFGQYGAAPGAVAPGTPVGFNPDGTAFSIGVAAPSTQNVVNFRGDTSDIGFNPDVYSYNFSPVNYLQLPLERRQIAAFGHYELAPEGAAEMYSRLMFTTYNADQELAASPVTCASAATPGCTLPVTNAAIPSDLARLASTRATPAGNLSFTTRTTDIGPRHQENGYDVMQGLLGFRGGFQLGSRDFGWDVYGSWGRAEGVSLQDGNVSRSRLQSALNNPAVFAAQGCAQFNPFGEGRLSPECARAIAIRASNVLEFEQSNIVASFTGSLFDLPAGPLDFAIGAEYREDIANFRPDEFLSSGDVVGFNAQQPVGGRITVTEPFVELVVPVLKELPFVNYLGIELGARTSDYNLAGKHDTYKAALQWAPVESLKLRGSFNRAIRAPNIQDLFLPRQENFPQYTDPCNVTGSFRTGSQGAQVRQLCLAQGIPLTSIDTFAQPNNQARAFVGGNINLQPEEADTYTLGLSWQSTIDNDWLRSFSASIDYFDYDITNVIGSLTASSIIGRCFNQLNLNPTFDPAASSCLLFTRNPANSGITDIQTTQLNLSARNVTGIDLNLNWGLPLTALGGSDGAGRLDFQLLISRFNTWEQQETATDPFFDRAGTISQTVASAFPEMKGVLATTYSWRAFQFRYNARYVDGMDVVNNDAILSAPLLSLAPSTPTYLYHDFTGKWDLNDMFGMTLGVTNIGDKAPPIYATNAQAGIQSNTDPSTYDVLGRRYFLAVTAKF